MHKCKCKCLSNAYSLSLSQSDSLSLSLCHLGSLICSPSLSLSRSLQQGRPRTDQPVRSNMNTSDFKQVLRVVSSRWGPSLCALTEGGPTTAGGDHVTVILRCCLESYHNEGTDVENYAILFSRYTIFRGTRVHAFKFACTHTAMLERYLPNMQTHSHTPMHPYTHTHTHTQWDGSHLHVTLPST